MSPLEIYVKWRRIELVAVSDVLSAAELQKRLVADDPIWRRGTFRRRSTAVEARPKYFNGTTTMQVKK